MASIPFTGDTSVDDMSTQCENCEQLFTASAFSDHVCGYSDRHTLIYDDQMLALLWEENPVRKVLNDNIKMIHQILQCHTDEVNVSDRLKDSKRSNAQERLACPVCHRKYVRASYLARHMNTEHNPNDMRSKLTVHQSNSSTDDILAEVIKCLVCGQIFNSLSSCFRHLKKLHVEHGLDESERSVEKLNLEQAFQCEFCDFLFADVAALFQHRMSHDVSTGYECSYCHLASRNIKFILSHRNNECSYEMSKREPKINCKLQFVCNECELPFGSLAQLYEHR